MGKTDLGKFDSLKNIIKKPITKQLIVVAWNVVAITLIPMYCNTALYNPILIKSGIKIIGNNIKSQNDSEI